eukprot:TRINITY_DN724_c0_g1_i1.p2 TRINITY_DN724_c0_g1~~TRINITY_DN724_c0_g1_i1.p2  ORF type:complete len:377 (-),score=19.74 TRINITY_DN724_c0_g1_i1:3064-4194(-)
MSKIILKLFAIIISLILTEFRLGYCRYRNRMHVNHKDHLIRRNQQKYFNKDFNNDLKLKITGKEWIPAKYCPQDEFDLQKKSWARCQRRQDEEDLGPFYGPEVVETQSGTSLFCAVYKSGSTAWKRVVQKALGADIGSYLYGKVHQVQVPQLEHFHGQDKYKGILNNPIVIRWIVVRNPYLRLHSAYHDKLVAGENATSLFYHNLFDLEYKYKEPASFANFVKKLYQKYLENGGLEWRKHINGIRYVIDPHFAWQTSFCSMLVGFGFDYVLKSELITEWYPNLIQMLNLTEVVMSGWPSSERCFVSVPRLQCNGPIIRSYLKLDQTLSQANKQSNLHKGENAYLHRRGSSRYILDAYDMGPDCKLSIILAARGYIK